MKLLLAILSLATCSFALQTKYLTFDEPTGWECPLSQGVYICQSSTPGERKESLILSIATVATEWDTLENYENYLKAPKTLTDDKGKAVTAKITYVRRRNINGHDWIDSLQHNSELPGFWTRYLATVQKPLAILLTYVVSEEKYHILAPSFERMVASLKPITDFKLSPEPTDVLPPGTQLGGKIQDSLKQLNSEAPIATAPVDEPSKFPYGQFLMLGGVIIVLALLVRQKRKK